VRPSRTALRCSLRRALRSDNADPVHGLLWPRKGALVNEPPSQGDAGGSLARRHETGLRDDSYRLISTAFVVTQYFASMLAFSHFGREAGSFR